MSHILEEYAKNLGVLISKPIISEHFFPLSEKKYITIYSENQIQSKNYKYYGIVIDLLRPVLDEENISIIQIDCKSNNIQGVNKSVGGLSFKQYAYIISKSIMHIGIDNVYSHYASSKNIPIVNLFGNIYPSISTGYWSNKQNKKDISAPWEVKPCLGLQDPKSEINLIKPEEIAQSILDLLNLKKKINFKTMKIGEMFLQPIYEVVPTSFHPISIDKQNIIFIRADYGFDQQSFEQYCSHYKVVIISENLINLNLINKYKQNINKISIFLKKNSETISEEFFETLKSWNITFQILVKDKNDLGFLKNKYFDHNVDLYKNSENESCNNFKKSFFFSNKKIFKDGLEYASKAHFKIGKNIVDNKMNVIDTPEYWEEQDHHYYYEQN